MTLRIKERRKALNIKQGDLAKKLNVNQTVLSNWEVGVSLPRADMLPLIASALKCSIEELYPEKQYEIAQ